MRLFIFMFFLMVNVCMAQIDSTKRINYTSLALNYQKGTIMPTTDFVKGDNLLGKPLTKQQSLSIKFLVQNPGYKEWQKIYHGPYYGLGVTIGDLFNPKELGNPVSGYGILGIPMLKFKHLSLYTELQYGIAANWKHYDSIDNPKNLAIGGKLTVHSKAGLHAFVPISKRLDLGAAVSFIHFSNGGFERPNKGMNIYGGSLELKYHPSGRPNTRHLKSSKPLRRKHDFYLMLGYGDHQLNDHELDSNYFSITGISLIHRIHLSRPFKLGYGVDANYWMGLTANSDGTMGPRNFDNLSLGLIIQPEFIIDKFTLVGGYGIYAKNIYYGNFKQSYQRLGFRYKFYNNLSIGINVRAVNLMLAEFMEFNLGYTFGS